MADHAASTDVALRCDLALDLARGAGDILRSGLGRATVEHKGTLELVTEFDRASERYIVDRMTAAVPADGPLAGGGGKKKRKGGGVGGRTGARPIRGPHQGGGAGAPLPGGGRGGGGGQPTP